MIRNESDPDVPAPGEVRRRKRSGIAVLLVLMIVLPLASAASDFKLLFSMGANLRVLPGYSYHYSIRVNQGNTFNPPEYGKGNDRLGQANIFGPDFGLGLSFKNVSLGISYASFSGNFTGTYDLSVPSTWFYNLIAADRISASSKFSGSSLAADLKYIVPLSRAFQVYAGAGARVLWADLELPQNIVFMEYFYRGPDFITWIHTLDITDVTMTPVSFKIFGWNALAGAEFTPAPGYWIFLEGRYQTGKKDVPHPYYAHLDPTLPPVHLDFSGFALTLGVRYALDW